MNVPPLDQYADLVAGEWSEPALTLDGWLEDPNTGERREPQRATEPATLERALAAASAVHDRGEWAAMPPGERVAALHAMADHLETRSAEVATLEAAETGAVISMTTMLTVILSGAFRLAAAQVESGWAAATVTGMNGNVIEVRRPPWGPAALLVPWNAPAPMAAHKAASALAAGCPVIVKPPELAPHGTRVVGDAAVAAGLPAGVVQVVNGGPDVGRALVADPRIRAVSFTGGLHGGREIAVTCASDFKPAQLELGGNNPLLVVDDADVEQVAAGVVSLLTSLNGQWCRALGRLIVPSAMADDIVAAAGEALARVRMGASTDPESQMGPMVHSRHVAVLRQAIADLEARGGKSRGWTPRPDLPGHFVAPTLVTGVAPTDCTDEVFGPVATVHPYSSVDEAVAIANGTPFGLEGYVFGGDEERALAVARRVRAGEVKVNGASVLSLDLMTPRPAWGWSGFSEEGTAETYRFFCGTQVVGVEPPFPAG